MAGRLPTRLGACKMGAATPGNAVPINPAFMRNLRRFIEPPNSNTLMEKRWISERPSVSRVGLTNPISISSCAIFVGEYPIIEPGWTESICELEPRSEAIRIP